MARFARKSNSGATASLNRMPERTVREPESLHLYGSAEPRAFLRRIESESEPPNLATEKSAGCGFVWARNPPSPVRLRKADRPKVTESRGFPDRLALLPKTLCNGRLDGGGDSLGRTRLCGLIPVQQGKYREIVSTSREIRASETGLQAEAIEPPHPPLSLARDEHSVDPREVPAARQVANILSDFDRPSFRTLRPRPSIRQAGS
jgi:hypothetical protein